MSVGNADVDSALITAWEGFCHRLREAGDQVFRESTPATDQDRTATFRYLAQNLGNAFEMAFENRDTRFPYVHPFVTPTRKLSGDAADQLYLQSWIDGQQTYRLYGNRGTVRHLTITVQGSWQGPLHDPFGDTPETSIRGNELDVDADGNFELWISPQVHEGTWLQSNLWTRKIFFRQGFDDWDEQPAVYWIERVDTDEPPRPPSHQDLVASLHWMGNFVVNTIGDWPDVLRARMGMTEQDTNRFLGQRERRNAVDAAQDPHRGRDIHLCHWRLDDEQALIFEFVPPQGGYWSVTNEHVNNDSQDFRYRPVSYTPSRSHVNADSAVRFVVSHRDPGLANWLDTSGYVEGCVMVRFMLTRDLPEVRAWVVPFDEVLNALPADVPVVSAAQLQRDLERRMRAITRRYQPWSFGI